MKPPAPIEFSEDQRGLILDRIAELCRDPTAIPEAARGAVLAAGVLPLCFDWSAVLALRPDGQMVWLAYDRENQDGRLVGDEDSRDAGLFQGGRLYPDLPFLIPRRPADAIDCLDCRGTGRPTPPRGATALPDNLVCSCGGRGWRRSTRREPTPAASRRRALIGLAIIAAGATIPIARPSGTSGPVVLKVDPSTAPEGVLEALPRIGPATARKIVAAREGRPFSDLDDFDRRVAGVGPVTREALRPHLRFEGGRPDQPKDR